MTKESAADLIPVGLRVGERWNGCTAGLATNRETSLGDPDRLRANSGLGLGNSVIKETLAVLNRIRQGAFEIGVRIDANEVRRVDDCLVRTIYPRLLPVSDLACPER